jgi:hypothetical protein
MMRRLIKKSEKTWYHLTNDSDFKPNANYQNNEQRMGPGLYLCPENEINFWADLMGRTYKVPVDISGLNILKISDLPSRIDLENELEEKGYDEDDFEKYYPNRDTMDYSKSEISIWWLYAEVNGYDALLDEHEGTELIVLPWANVNVGSPEPIE